MAEAERSIFDAADEDAEVRALAAADADIAAGRGHPHELVRRWRDRLVSGGYEPFDPSGKCE
ncbi:MAG TPA: CopG family transcriptional regulator [Rhodospirillaceae bacterium]|nr:CopG family transcriptional regulator [Rhodospirillaceae bacterium]